MRILGMLTHSGDKPIRVEIVDLVLTGSRDLLKLQQTRPDEFRRLAEYKQCRFKNRTDSTIKHYWFMLEDMDQEVISLLISKELQAHAVSGTRQGTTRVKTSRFRR